MSCTAYNKGDKETDRAGGRVNTGKKVNKDTVGYFTVFFSDLVSHAKTNQDVVFKGL